MQVYKLFIIKNTLIIGTICNSWVKHCPWNHVLDREWNFGEIDLASENLLSNIKHSLFPEFALPRHHLFIDVDHAPFLVSGLAPEFIHGVARHHFKLANHLCDFLCREGKEPIVKFAEVTYYFGKILFFLLLFLFFDF